MLNEAEYANSTEPDFVVAEKFKQLREQWHLGHFIRIYNVSAETQLIFGEHLAEASDAQPDFVVYDGSGAMHCYIEVTEWLEPYRKRDLEYRTGWRPGGRLADSQSRRRLRAAAGSAA
jgi:hypothetical protein